MTRPSSAPTTFIVLCLTTAMCATPDPADTTGSVPVTDTDEGTLAASSVPFVPLRRLNHAEYDRTMQDLTGLDLWPSAEFPEEASAYGFDTVAAVLTISPLLVEKYADAAHDVVDAIVDIQSTPSTRIELEDFDWGFGGAVDVAAAEAAVAWTWWTSETVDIPFATLYDGDVQLILSVGYTNGQDATRNLQISVDEQALGTVDIQNRIEDPMLVEFTASLTTGEHMLQLSFLDGLPPESPSDPMVSTVAVDYVDVIGPTPTVLEPNAFFTCTPTEQDWHPCAEELLTAFAHRAWRRPITDAEVDRFLTHVDLAADRDDTFEDGVAAALRAILLSPNFLFRVENDPDLTDTSPHLLDDHELATRLSYFLWSSTPDDELLHCADIAGLYTDAPDDPCSLSAQTDRLLDDARSSALVDRFFDQWLFLTALDGAYIDPNTFPHFDEELRASMLEETERVVSEVVSEDRDLLDLFDADFTWVDERLAQHYGLPEDAGQGFYRVDLSEHPERGGVLTHASWLTVTSQPTRTSPTERGKWILGQLLCDAPPPPPVGQEIDAANDEELMELLDQHAIDPECVACHELMDPIGYSLEHYDGIGEWRDEVGGAAVDAIGEMPDGSVIVGFEGLQGWLRAQEDVGRCVASHLVTYGLARGGADEDTPLFDQLASEGLPEGFHSMVRQLITTESFQSRRAEGTL